MNQVSFDNLYLTIFQHFLGNLVEFLSNRLINLAIFILSFSFLFNLCVCDRRVIGSLRGVQGCKAV